MSTFTVTHQQITDNVCVVQTLESTDILVGQEITLSGCDASINGVHTVFQIPIYYFIGINDAGDYLFNDQILFKNQILFQLVDDDIAREAVDPVGTLTWTTPTECQWSDVPDAAVLAGTVLMAASLYRERGSIDSFNSFQDMTISAPVASMGRINSLLGNKRAQVA